MLHLEYPALACNTRSALFGRTSAHAFAARHGLTDAVAATTVSRASGTRSVYELRRVYTARRSNPDTKGQAWRSLRRAATGDRQAMLEHLRRQASAAGIPVEVDDLGIVRAWIRRAGTPYPTAEHMFVLAPGRAQDKQRPGFERMWRAATSERQLALFATTLAEP